jgi:hypothetical protein
LIVSGGKGHSSHISVIKKGISINNLTALNDIPALSANGIFTIDDLVLIRFFGQDSFILL